jgi:hypothetical protein
MICTSLIHPMHPLDSTELLGLKENIKSSFLRNLSDFSIFLHYSPYIILFHHLFAFLNGVHYKTLNLMLGL